MTAPDIALIAPFPPGAWTGVAAYTSRLALALRDAGARVVVLADGDGAVSRADDIEIRRVWTRGPSALPRAVAAALATRAPAVHIQHELMLYGGPAAAPAILPALALLRAARRTVVTMHHVLDPDAIDAEFTETHHVAAPATLARAGGRTLQRGIRALADAVIVHEPESAALLPGAKLIPHGIDARPPSPRDAARDALGLDRDRVVALCFGFLAPYKGLELAIEAAREAGAQLVLAGAPHPRVGDAYAERLRALAPPDTRFTGFVPDADVAGWFAAADAALLLYPRPFATSGPLALALSHGTPMLLSPGLARMTGAPPELAVELDARVLAARLRALRDPDERAALSERAQALAAGRRWPDAARAHLEV